MICFLDPPQFYPLCVSSIIWKRRQDGRVGLLRNHQGWCFFFAVSDLSAFHKLSNTSWWLQVPETKTPGQTVPVNIDVPWLSVGWSMPLLPFSSPSLVPAFCSLPALSQWTPKFGFNAKAEVEFIFDTSSFPKWGNLALLVAILYSHLFCLSFLYFGSAGRRYPHGEVQGITA